MPQYALIREFGKPSNDKEGPSYCSRLNEDGLTTVPAEGHDTMYRCFQHICHTAGSNRLLAYREELDIIEEEKWITKTVNGESQKQRKTWQYYQFSDYRWHTGHETTQIVDAMGSAVASLGLTAQSNVLLYAPTACEWMLFMHSCFRQALPICTAYDSLGEEGLSHALNECEVECTLTKANLLEMLLKIHSRTPKLRHIVYFGRVTDKVQQVLDRFAEEAPHVQLHSWDAMLARGQQTPSDPTPPSPEDTACIMYTSGSTGTPKGVIMTHGNLVAAMAGGIKVLARFFEPGDVFLAYLPLAHVLEMIAEHVVLYIGVKMGFGSPRTLTNQSVRKCQGDLCALRPTLMVGVPQVWDTIRKGVLSTVAKSGAVVQSIFNMAFEAKWFLMKYSLPTGLLDQLVFRKVQEQTGGRLRYVLSGGAGISADSQKFLSVTLCPVIQGYGMTENGGIVTLMDPGCFGLKTVGPPLPSTEVKLVAVEDTEYTGANGKGEIWVRGPALTKGYYKQEELTKESYTEDGWFKSGDIGEWQPDGQLAIIDRKKNLVKLAHGEYIALEKLESVYKTALLVTNICVCADENRTRPVALVVPDAQGVIHLAKSQGLLDQIPDGHDHDMGQLTELREVKQAVMESCRDAAKSHKLASIEYLEDIYLVPDEWTPQNGMLTPAQKLNRRAVHRAYSEQLRNLSG
ncbi:long-chain fatty acid-CoA ligase [Dimargaris xerosporica]|nr:long-chain fatty acid-CoA ligase [Dimargaris xerosporica]